MDKEISICEVRLYDVDNLMREVETDFVEWTFLPVERLFDIKKDFRIVLLVF